MLGQKSRKIIRCCFGINDYFIGTFWNYLTFIKQDSIFLARGKLSDESEIKISTQTDGLFKNLFAWKEESNCDNGWGYIVFVDRSFEMKTKTGEMIKIAIILSYDTPKTISFKVKIIQGANLFTKMKVMKFTYAHGGKKGYFGTGSTPGIVYILGV